MKTRNTGNEEKGRRLEAGGRRAPKAPRIIRIGSILLALGLLVGCFNEEPLSWSPDGRYLAYAAGDRGALWRWDSKTRQSEKIEFTEANTDIDFNERVHTCRYYANDTIVFITLKDNDKNKTVLYVGDLKTKQCHHIGEITGPSFDVSEAGRIYFRGEDPNLEGEQALLEYSGGQGGATRTLLTNADQITFLRLDPDGKRLAFCDDSGLELLDLATSETQTLLKSTENIYHWPVWVDEDRLLVMKKSGEDTGILLELTLDGATTRTLAEGLSLAMAPVLNPGGGTVAFVAQPADRTDGDGQIAVMNIDSGRKVWLTKEVFGTQHPVYAPDGNSMAYLVSLPTKGDATRMLKLMDLASGRVEVAWRTEEERLFAAAETLSDAGHPAQALAMLEDLQQRFPKSALLLAAKFRMMLLRLDGPLSDLDQAWERWGEISQEAEVPEMPTEVARFFWHPADRVATDPAGDWITSFNTPEATKAFGGANTDEARDLRALWVRAGKDKLYLRIDIGGKTELDPSGVALLDTLILIKDAATSDTAPTPVGPNAAWRHTASRRVLVRHWAVSGAASQYDAEIRDQNGETLHRFLASGFAPPSDPLFDRVAFVPGTEGRGAVYAVSREALGIKGPCKIAIQVLTLKGGIDPRGATELPADTGCGVADAFGTENAPEKVRARTQPGKPVIIEGEAAVVGIE